MRLPDGYVVRLDPAVQQRQHGTLLVGGSPLTALLLSSRARALLDDGTVSVSDDASARLAERLLERNLAHPHLADLDPANARDLTVVIPVRDRTDALDRCLARLSPLRIVVVDDASSDAATVAALARRHGAELIALPTNLGPAGARNAGLARVVTPLVAFVDSDVQVSAADLVTLSGHFADPALALVGPRVRAMSRSARPAWFERYDEVASSLDLGAEPGVVRHGAKVTYLPSACLIARTEAVSDALMGGFDTDLRVGEDVDLVWRLSAAGRRVRYEPGISVTHDTRPSWAGWLGRTFLYGTSAAPLAHRHGNAVAPAVLSPLPALAAATVLARSRWAPAAVAIALAHSTYVVRRDTGTTSLALSLSARGLAWAVRQETSLVLRHWWPATLVAAASSQRIRRVALTALLVDAGLARELALGQPGAPFGVVVLGRRLTDLAYGAGLWWGAAQHHSPAALLPRKRGGTRGPGIRLRTSPGSVRATADPGDRPPA